MADGTSGRRADVQFGCYLTPDEAARLASYAEGLQINRANLGILLIVRELRCKQLRKLPRWSGPQVTKKNGTRVSARGNFEVIKVRFHKWIDKVGLGTDEAVAMLFRQELEEKWLAQSLATKGNHP